MMPIAVGTFAAAPFSCQLELAHANFGSLGNNNNTDQALQPTKQIEGNLIRQKRVYRRRNSNPSRPKNENNASPKDIRDPTPEQQQTAER
jgi:hypothetical protein